MGKIFVVYPNISIEEDGTFFDMEFKPYPPMKKEFSHRMVGMGLAYHNAVEEKSVLRQIEILSSHFMTAAYIHGYDPILVGRGIQWRDGEDKPDIQAGEKNVSLLDLVNKLPKQLEDSSRTFTWFSRYLEQPKNNERSRVIRLYNALGTLPMGFNKILSLAIMEKDRAMLEKLINRKEDLKREDMEELDFVPYTVPLSNDEMDLLEEIYIRNLIKYFLK